MMRVIGNFIKKTAVHGLIGFLVVAPLLVRPVFASSTDGTISSSDKLAYFLDDAFGSINFGLTQGNVHVTDAALTGYAWSELYGWINLSPTTSGVVNDGEGVMSGYAWGENLGWINFKPTNGGVTIDSSGEFHGYAWSERAGWILFNCASNSSCGALNFKISTDWRPASARVVTPVTPPCTNCGGSGGSSVIPPTQPVTPVPSTPPTVPQTPPTIPSPSVVPSPPTTPPTQPPPSTVPTPITPSTPPPNTTNTTNPGGGPGDYVPPGLISIIVEQIAESYRIAGDVVGQTVKAIEKIITDPAGSVVVKTVSTAGVIVAGAVSLSSLFLTPLTFSELLLIPFRLWALLMSALGLRKRNRPWGIVYDSVTKQPLDPAYVTLENEKGATVGDSITDLDGRYGFFVPYYGTYRIDAKKTNYRFPSTKLSGMSHDELYSNLYFGEPITAASGEVIVKNIPLDPVDFDWNEFAKGREGIMRFYSRRERFVRHATDWIFRVGFVISIIAAVVAPAPYNIAMFAVYILLVVLRMLGVRPKLFGSVREKTTGYPLSFAIVRIFSPIFDQEVAHRVCDKLGRYYCLVPNGEYYIKIDKKLPNESYETVFGSDHFDIKNGIINREFKI